MRRRRSGRARGGNKYRLLRTVLWVITILIAAILIANAIKGRQKVDVNSIDSDWSKLMVILKTMDENYVDDIDHKKVTEDILPALMKELDPHSVYLPPSDLKEAEESLQGGFDGIGIQFNVPADTAIVTSVIVGGPSEKAYTWVDAVRARVGLCPLEDLYPEGMTQAQFREAILNERDCEFGFEEGCTNQED